MTRERLPGRRPCESREIEIEGLRCHVTAGFDEAGRPREIFFRGGKQGSAVDTLLDDMSVVISVALQHGIRPADLARSLSRRPGAPLRPADLDRVDGDRRPASIVGAAIDLLVDLDGGEAGA